MYQPPNDPNQFYNDQTQAYPPYQAPYQQPGNFYPPPPPTMPPPTKPYSTRALWLLIAMYGLVWILTSAGQKSGSVSNLAPALLLGVIVSVLMLDIRGYASLQSNIKERKGLMILLCIFFFPLWLGGYLLCTLLAYYKPPLNIAPVRRKATVALVSGMVVALFIFTVATAQASQTPTVASSGGSTVLSVQDTPTAAFIGQAQPTTTTAQSSPTPVLPTVTSLAPTPTQAKPTMQPTWAPTPTPVPTQATHTGVNGNPWGYDFTPGNLIYNPDSGFCSYFTCVSTFWTATSGYVAECADGHYTHSGGVKGACSRNGGVSQILYSH